MSPKKRSPWPFGIAVGLGLVVVSNLTMVTIALNNPSAPASDDHYQEGLKQDQRAAEARDAAALGWNVTLDLCAAHTPAGCSVQVTVRDKNHQPVLDLGGEVEIRRSDDPELDRTSALAEAGAGVYAGELALAEGGLYDVRLRLQGPAGTWVTRQRSWIGGRS